MVLTRRKLLGLFSASLLAKPALAQVTDRFAGFREILDTARADKSQFLLMYDTNHQNRDMPTYPLLRDALDVAQGYGVKNIFLEFPREFQQALNLRADGRINHESFLRAVDAMRFFKVKHISDITDDDKRDIVKADFDRMLMHDRDGGLEYLTRLSQGLVDAKARGIRVWGADAGAHVNMNDPVGISRFAGDGEVADYIAGKARGQKSIITYGALHGSIFGVGDSSRLPGGGLDDELRRHARVTTVEMQDTPPIPDGTMTARLDAEDREMLPDKFNDRSPNRLNIDTGVLTRVGKPDLLQRIFSSARPAMR